MSDQYSKKENPTTFRISSGIGTEEHIVHVVEYYSTEGMIDAEYDEIMFCVDPLRNIDVDYSINKIKSGNTIIKKTHNSDVVIVKIGNEYKIEKSRFYNGAISGLSLSATQITEQTAPPKQKKKPNKKIAPPIGTIYILDEGNNSYWLAIDYNTYELIGTVRNTKLLQLIIRHDLDKYLSTGLIKYSKDNIPRKK